MMLPDHVKAAGDGGNTGISIGGYYADRKPFVYVDFTCGAWGARPWADGLDGNSHMFANMASHSIEVTEAEQPIQLLGLRVRAGQGRRRQVSRRRAVSGATTASSNTRAMLQVRSDRRDHRPFGLYGGSPGGPSENYLDPGYREPRAAVEAHHEHSSAAKSSATCSPAPAAGAIRWSATRRRCCAMCATSCCRRRRPRRTTASSIDTARVDGRRGGDTAKRRAEIKRGRAAGPRCRRCSGTIRCRLQRAAE